MKRIQYFVWFFLLVTLVFTVKAHAGGAVGEAVMCTQDYTKSTRFLAPIRIQDVKSGDSLTQGLPAVGYYLFDGTNWDRARGDTTYGLDVDVTRMPSGLEVSARSDTTVNITTSTDTDVISSSGSINKIIVNAGGTGSVISIYDDADGTCSSGYAFKLPTVTDGQIYDIDHEFSTGICATTTDTGGAADISILYR